MIWTGLTKYRDLGLLVLRVGLGAAFIAHGWDKLIRGPEFWTMVGKMGGFYFIPTFWGFIAAMIEFGGGILFALGLLFRPACLLLVLQMCVALGHHLRHRDGFPVYSHALEDGVVFLGMLLIGPGKHSVDRK